MHNPHKLLHWLLFWGVSLYVSSNTKQKQACASLLPKTCVQQTTKWYCSDQAVKTWLAELSSYQVYTNKLKLLPKQGVLQVSWDSCDYVSPTSNRFLWFTMDTKGRG